MRREFTGKHMATVMVTGFGIVIAVNFYMASLAISGFGGVVVDNSYVASQKFNDWLEQAREVESLGYTTSLERDEAGHVLVTTDNVPEGADLTAAMRRPLGLPEHTDLQFEQIGEDAYRSTAPLPAGRWIARLTIETGGTPWIGEMEVR